MEAPLVDLEARRLLAAHDQEPDEWKTVRTLTGGEARGQITPSWDGWTGVTGVGVPDATYAWTVTAWPADGRDRRW